MYLEKKSIPREPQREEQSRGPGAGGVTLTTWWCPNFYTQALGHCGQLCSSPRPTLACMSQEALESGNKILFTIRRILCGLGFLFVF